MSKPTSNRKKYFLYLLIGFIALTVIVHVVFSPKKGEPISKSKDPVFETEENGFSPSRTPYWLNWRILDLREDNNKLVFQVTPPYSNRENLSLQTQFHQGNTITNTTNYYLSSITGSYIRLIDSKDTRAMFILRTPNPEKFNMVVLPLDASISNDEKFSEDIFDLEANTKMLGNIKITHSFELILPASLSQGIYTSTWGDFELSEKGLKKGDEFFPLVGSDFAPSKPFYSSLYFDINEDSFYGLSLNTPLILERWVYSSELERFHIESSVSLELK